MGTGRASGSAAIGCGGVSLLGLLVGVGLVVWLGAATLSDRGPSAEVDAPLLGEASNGAAGDVRDDGVEVAVDPADGLVGDDRVRVTAGGFAAGATVTVVPCGPGNLALVDGPEPCDADHRVEVAADGDGRVEVTLVLPRVLSAGPLPYDCASALDPCRLRVTGPGEGTTTPLAGEAVLRYADDLPPPPLPGLDDLGP